MIFDDKVEKIEEIIGYRFRDRSLLRQAFTRTSWCNEQNRRGRVKFQSSEVLEFIGDSALSTAIITMLLLRKNKATNKLLTFLPLRQKTKKNTQSFG